MRFARRAWTCFEAIHALVYFAPEPRARYQAAGLRGGWMGYFASRSAPMGPVGPEVVAAAFFGFHPEMVRRAIPDAWRYSTPESVLEARHQGADSALRRLWGDLVDAPATAMAADLALRVAGHGVTAGRPIFAAHLALPVPEARHLALWHACTLLREHRFDGHVAALTVHGLDGCEALVTALAAGGLPDADTIRAFRGWPVEAWQAAERRLRDRGLLTEGLALTAKGAALRQAVEDTTDDLAEAPWEVLNPPEREQLLELLRPLALALRGPDGLVYPNPIGVPQVA